MRPSASLRMQLLAWLLVPLCFVVAFNVWSAYSNARLTAGVITDRLLLTAARVLAEQVKVEDGVVEALIPPSALGIFASVGQDRALYMISGPDGRLIAGYPDVPPPPQEVEPDEPVYFSDRFRSQDVRAVALRQPLPNGTPGASVLIIVGETLRDEDRIVAELWQKEAWRQAFLVVMAAALIWYGLHLGLAPMLALRDHVRDRDPQELMPFAPEAVPSELQPVVGALNDAVARVKRQIATQRQFLADAAHQLRTPLTLMKTQASVGLRASGLDGKDEALAGIDQAADGMTRLTNQLLSLARAEPGSMLSPRTSVSLADIARKVLEVRAGRALDRQIDLSFEAADGLVEGDAALLAEMIANLVDNALIYTPPGGRVVVAVAHLLDSLVLRVEDNGPGITEAEHEKVFDRFYRIAGTSAEGSGLGLAIVREIAAAHGARIELSAARESGLVVEVAFVQVLLAVQK